MTSAPVECKFSIRPATINQSSSTTSTRRPSKSFGLFMGFPCLMIEFLVRKLGSASSSARFYRSDEEGLHR